jgi:hypothetical protein
MAEVELIQELTVRWVAGIRGGNSGQQDTGGKQNSGSCVGERRCGDHDRGRVGVMRVDGMGRSSWRDKRR